MTTQSCSYDKHAWEKRGLYRLYDKVGWTPNRQHTIELLTTLPFASMLDIGCLDGAYIRQLRKQGLTAAYTGVDVTHAHVKLAQARTPGELFRQADARALPFKNETFDLVLFSDVIQHLHPDDQAKALNEACRVARHHVILSTYGTDGATITQYSPKFLNTYFNRADTAKLIPADFILTQFHDFAHPTCPADDRQHRIHHFVLIRKRDKVLGDDLSQQVDCP